MKKYFRYACMAISTAVLIALLTTSLVFAESETPENPDADTGVEQVDETGADEGETPSVEEATETTDGDSTAETPDASGETGEDGQDEVIPEDGSGGESTTEEGEDGEDPETQLPEEENPESIEEEVEPVSENGQEEESPDENSGEESVEDLTLEEDPETIVLSDENGEPLDMASQESADAVASGDPWWISGGVKYAVVFSEGDCPSDTVYGSTCWANDYPIEHALSLIDGNNLVPSDGKLYVEAGNYSDNVVIDGSSGNGNLSGLTGLIGSGSGTITLTGSINISNTTSGFTLSGFTVNGAVSLDNNSGSLYLEDLYISNENGDGLNVTNQNGSVYLTNVQSRGNKGDGANIDNTASTSGLVNITSSSFDFNDDESDLTWNVGLNINTNGKVFLEGVSASRNNGSGALISGFTALTVNNSIFDRNFVDPFSSSTPYGYGLQATTSNAATVTLKNVYAYYNDNTAIDIVTGGSVFLTNVRGSHTSVRVGEIDSSGETVNERLSEDNKYTGDRWYFNGTTDQVLDILLESDAFDAYLELYDASDDSLLAFNDNIDGETTNSQINYTLLADGVYYLVVKTLESSGSTDGDYALTLNDALHANETSFDNPGLSVDTTSGSGSITIYNGMFQDNVGDGMVLDTLRKIYLKTVDASYNSGNGAVLDNCQYDDVLGQCLGSGSITFISPSSSGWYGANYFLGNSGSGIVINTGSATSISNTSAYENQGNGLVLQNPYTKSKVAIQVKLANFTNVFRDNGLSGVVIDVLGGITIYDTEADSNGVNGFELSSGSTINLSKVSASNNGNVGLLIQNEDSAAKIILKNKIKNGQGEFNDNGGNGIDITALGTIYLYNITANDNGGSGMVLDNCVLDSSTCLGTGQIYLSTYYSQENLFNDNEEYGLNLTSGGHIKLNYLSASGNGDTGVFIDTTDSDASVSILNKYKTSVADFTYNGGDGINISAKGNITLYNVNASSNANSGLALDTCLLVGEECLGYGKVIVKSYYGQVNQFDNNHDYGVFIESGHSVSLANIQANSNGFSGLYVNNSLELGVQPVVLTASKGNINTFNYNGSNLQGSYPGIEIKSFGYIYIYSVEANNNYAAGAYLYNKDATITPSYMKIYESVFNENQGSGLIAESTGKIYVKGLTASYNSLINSDIVLEGETVYERLTSISEYDTWWFEITAETTIQDFLIILESTEFDALLELYDDEGNLLATDDNSFSEVDAEIEINLTEIGVYYIRVLAADDDHGNYTLSINDELHNYTTDFRFYGALLDNSSGAASVDVSRGKTVTSNDFNDNNYRGLEINSMGTIKAYDVSASDNGDTGAYFTNKDGSGGLTVMMRTRGAVGQYNSNTEWGVYAASRGTISLSNISANSNGSAGALLNNCVFDGEKCLGKGNVYVKASRASNEFSGNQLYGLWISSSGSVSLYDMEANSNGYGGLYVKNQYDDLYGSVTLKSSKNHTSSFSGNGWMNPMGVNSIEVISNGTIKLTAGDVVKNYGGGILLQNNSGPYARHVYLYETNIEANQGNGLWVDSNGSVYLYGTQSRYNSVSSGEIDILGESVFEHLTPYYESDTWWFSGEGEIDLILESDEFDVLLQVYDKNGNLIAVDDDSYGETDARLTFTLPGNDSYYILVSGNSDGTGNYTLSLNDAALEYPTLYRYSGAVINNSYGSGHVYVKYSKTLPNPSFYHNNFNGLEILSSGSVYLYDLSAMKNGEDGVNVNNTTGSGKVYLYSSSKIYSGSFSYNTKFGLYVESNGTIYVRNKRGRLFLRDNGYSGAYLDNSTGVDASVTVIDAEVNENGLKGLEIHSSGKVVVSSILAINNESNGVYIQNDYGTGTVSVLGSRDMSNISDNGATGLAVYSSGQIIVDNINAIQNGGRGMILSNESGSGKINVTDSITRLNARHGLQIYGNEVVYLKNVHSMSNGMDYEGDGLWIELPNASDLKIYKSSFIGNEGSGIDLGSDFLGVPTLSSVNYFGNDTNYSGDYNYYAHYSS